MNRKEIMDWARGYYGPAARGVLSRLAAQVDALAPRAGGPFLIDYFEAAVNSADRFGRVKLVHVAGLMENATPEKKRAAALDRRKTLERLFRSAPGFDLRSLERMYDSIFRAGLDEFFPVASVEWDLGTGRFEEVSLYCDRQAEAVAIALGGGQASDLGPLYAVGYDFRPGRPSRLKLYHRRRVGLGAHGSGRPFRALPARCRPEEFLVLRRRPEGGRFERTRKVYLCYLSPEAVRIECRVARLAQECGPGPLKGFFGSLLPSAADHWLDYIGCEDGRFEAYLAKPAWRAGLRRAPARGDRLWVVP